MCSFGLAIVVITSYPIQAFVFRISARSLAQMCRLTSPNPTLDRVKSSRIFVDDFLTMCSVLFFILVTAIVGFAVTDMGIVVDITGSTGASILAYVAPGIIYAYTFKSPRFASARVLGLLISAFGVFLMISGVVLAFVPEKEWSKVS